VRIAFHAINGVGLGHLVRATTLATEMRSLMPGIQILVLTNARDTTMLSKAKLDFVQLPPRLNEPHADPDRCLLALPEALEETALASALDAFEPDLVVFDTHAPMSLVRYTATIGARAVLVLRELRPEALRSFVASGAATSFDRIVLPHEPGEVDVEPLDGAPVVLVGPIVRDMTARRTRARRDRLRVVAMAGGGGQPVDARRYVRAVADAHLLARARIPRLETTLVVGPYGSPPANLERYEGLSIVRQAKDLPALLADAALVVSQAGYNAVAELRSLEKPAILVPGHRKAEDQRARALRLQRAKVAVIARPEARSIADRIEKLLCTPGALEAMSRAHAKVRQRPNNRAAARAVLHPLVRETDRPPRVVLVAHDFAPKLGGMETAAQTLAERLTLRGADVHVYTSSRLGAETASGLPSVRALYRPLPPPQRIDLSSDLLLTIDAALRDAPDVIHLCNAGLGPWVSALRAALPCVVTANVHGNDLLSPWVHPGDFLESYRAAQIDGLSATDAVFCVSHFSRALAQARGVHPSVLHTIENGVDPSRFARGDKTSDLRRRLGLCPEDEVILTVSRLAPRKGHRTVLHAVARLAEQRPHLKYVFTGSSRALETELAALARELGIASRVVVAGFISNDELPSLYRMANVFALLVDPADDDVEGFGIALLEAAASGICAVASRCGGISEAVVDEETGLLVPSGDAGAAAQAFQRLLGDPSMARRFGERGRERVVECFTDLHAADRALDVWTAILACGPRTPTGNDPRRAVELVRSAQRHAESRRQERRNRLQAWRRVIDRGEQIRLRATSDGARVLPEALADCITLGHRPRVEVQLRTFTEPDFHRYALPAVSEINLVHGVPHRSADAIFTALRRAPAEALERVRIVRLFLTHEARASTALTVASVTEAHALRRFFSDRGVTVVPPPELMRYLSDVPAGGPETGMIEPTNLCNLACPTCPTGTGKIKPLPPMTMERFRHVLDALAPRLRNLALWNYGEPLLHRDLPAMIAHAKRAGVGVVKVSSNAHFLDGSRGLRLLESGLDVLILSVDGASERTYATFRKDGDFAKVSSQVAWLCAEKSRLGLNEPRIELQFIVMRHNEHELPDIRRLAKEWGVDALRIKTVGAEDEATRDLVPTARLLSRYKEDHETPNVRHPFCTMAWDHTVVNVDGSVTPCCYLRPDMGNAFVMGNVFETPFIEIWRGEKYRAFRAAMLDGRGSLPVCNRCRGGTHDLIAAVEEVSS